MRTHLMIAKMIPETNPNRHKKGPPYKLVRLGGPKSYNFSTNFSTLFDVLDVFGHVTHTFRPSKSIDLAKTFHNHYSPSHNSKISSTFELFYGWTHLEHLEGSGGELSRREFGKVGKQADSCKVVQREPHKT